MAEHFCLKWNNYRPNLTSAFKSLREGEDFVDVTLSADGLNLKAHKVVLSACSNYFRDLLRGISSCQHPVIFLRDIPVIDLSLVLEFVYVGEVSVSQVNLQSFLKTAGLLRIKGLAEDDDEVYPMKSRQPSSDLTKQPDEQSARKRKLEVKEIKPVGVKKHHPAESKAAAKPEAGVDPDAAAGDGGELTPKQEPFDDSAAVVHDESAANYPAADSSAIYPAADSAAAIYPAADNPAGGYSAAGNAGSHGFVIPDTPTDDKTGPGSSVTCHVCRALLSNTNALYYHMNYVHSSGVQNLEIIRSGVGGAQEVLVKEEN